MVADRGTGSALPSNHFSSFLAMTTLQLTLQQNVTMQMILQQGIHYGATADETDTLVVYAAVIPSRNTQFICAHVTPNIWKIQSPQIIFKLCSSHFSMALMDLMESMDSMASID